MKINDIALQIEIKIDRLMTSHEKYKEQLSRVLPFGREYWKLYDKTTECLIKISCYKDILKLVRSNEEE